MKHRNNPRSGLPPIRLVLMSATIQTEKFVSYLMAQLKQPQPVVVHHIEGYTYPVTEFFRGEYEKLLRNNEDNDSYRYGGWAKAGAIDYDLLVSITGYMNMSFVTKILDSADHSTSNSRWTCSSVMRS